MAQRALGALPTAEPLKPSRYAPKNIGADFGARGEADFASATFVEAEAAPARSATPGAPTPRAPTSVAPAPVSPGPEAPAPILSRDRPPAAPIDPGGEAEAPPRRDRAEPAPRALAEKRFERPARALASEAAEAPATRADDAPESGPSTAPERYWPENPPPDFGREDERMIAVAQPSVFSPRVASEPSRQRAARAEPVAATPTESRTEIHISIGAIELRAPRSQAAPPPQAFRPRVSLEEFLSRKPGGSE
jgi:hypothetical protein